MDNEGVIVIKDSEDKIVEEWISTEIFMCLI